MELFLTCDSSRDCAILTDQRHIISFFCATASWGWCNDRLVHSTKKPLSFFLFKCHSKFYTLSRQTLLFFETINFCQSKLFLCDFSISKFCSAGGTCIHTHVTSIVVTMEKVVWCAAFSAIFSLFPIVLFRQCRTDRQSQTCSWMAIRGQCDWCWGVFLGTVFFLFLFHKNHTSLLMSHFLLLWCGF